jgi:hypothetical protein
MARTDDPNSATSQFFINHVDNISLDRQGSSAGYCVFGKVSHGLNVVDTIAASTVVDYYPTYSNDPFDTIPSPFIGIYAARVVSTVLATKCTITAVNKANSDKSSFSGTMNATVDDFNDANDMLEITIDSNDIVNPYALTFPINNKTFKKGKYSYSGTENGIKKSFTYDMKTGKFAFAASNISLSGLDCPVILGIEIGNYVGVAEVNEAIVNGPKAPMPILLMMGIKDTLRVDTCTVKQNNKKANSDQLTVKGAFAVKDTTVDMTKKEFVATLGAQTFTLPIGSFKRGKGAYSCANVKITGGTASATFNFNLCSFILTIKNANISPVSGNVDFGIRFADFNEVEQVKLP